MKRTLAIIPARSGSKGLPGKNILNIAGKPLIAWSILNAKKSKLLTDIVISTDDNSIKNIAEKYEGKVPFIRPKELAEDTSGSVDVVLHCINQFEEMNIFFDNVILLEPTSPLRKSDDVDKALFLFYKNYSDVDGVISLGKIHLENPVITKYVKQNFIFPISLGEMNEPVMRRQEYPDYFFLYGVLYIIKTEVLKRKKTFYTDKIMPYFIERWQNYELDDIYDFYAIEAIMKNKINDIE